MRVERISLVQERPAPAATGALAVSSAAAAPAPAEEPAAPPPPERIPERPSGEPASAAPVREEAPPPAEAGEEEVAEESPSLSAEAEEKAAVMARQEYGSAQWTQRYCTAHIGFCIPVHRNWWFRSFGATTTSLWHVELGASEIVNLGDGSIVVRLLSGTVESQKGLNGQVRDEGAHVVGFRSWTENRHFEIVAPASLRPAVQHLTDHLKPFEEEPQGGG